MLIFTKKIFPILYPLLKNSTTRITILVVNPANARLLLACHTLLLENGRELVWAQDCQNQVSYKNNFDLCQKTNPDSSRFFSLEIQVCPERTRSSWPQVGGSWQISGFYMKQTAEIFSSRSERSQSFFFVFLDFISQAPNLGPR